MRSRRKSLFERIVDLVPALVVVGVGVAGVSIAMNVLVTAPPVAIFRSPGPSASVGPSFPDSPSPLALTSAEPSVTPVPTASLTNQQPRFVHSVIKDADSGGVWSVQLNYPAFILGQTPWAQQIDSDIRGDLNTRADQWELGPAAYRSAKGKTNTLTGSFTTEMVTPTLASWTLTFVDDSATTTPVTTIETLNYDLGTGQRIVLDDIFIDSTSAMGFVSDLAPAYVKGQLGADYDPALVSAGTSPLLANWDHWALTKTGLRITFDPYQVSIHAAPLVSIVVPWSALTSVMIQTGPVARLAGLSS
jgi:hypothetical protein